MIEAKAAALIWLILFNQAVAETPKCQGDIPKHIEQVVTEAIKFCSWKKQKLQGQCYNDALSSGDTMLNRYDKIGCLDWKTSEMGTQGGPVAITYWKATFTFRGRTHVIYMYTTRGNFSDETVEFMEQQMKEYRHW